MAAKITIQALEELQNSGQTFQKELLHIPFLAAAKTLDHFSPRKHLAGKLTVSEMDAEIELAPFDADNESDADIKIKPRTLETFLGSAVKHFVPNQIATTIWGDDRKIIGKEQMTTEAAKQFLAYCMAKIGKQFNYVAWGGKRQEEGKTTATLCDGFDTITAAEILATNISEEKGNYKKFATINAQNAVDTFKAIDRTIVDELGDTPRKMFISREWYNNYLDDYQATVGATPYNREFKKVFLEGSDDLCELVPMVGKKGSKFIHVSPQSNMLYGTGNGLIDESCALEKYKSFKVTFEAAMFLGFQFQSIAPERLFVAEIGELP